MSLGQPVDFARVEAVGLTKLFGPTRAIVGVDLVFEPGRVHVVEGPNGSGKSTLLALLGQLARPTRGALRYGEHTARTPSAALRARIGVLAHAAMLYPDLTGRENLHLFADLYALEDAALRIARALDRFDIGAFVDRPTRTYSRGQLQRISLARSLVHEPRLLLLDEPSTGLDVASTDRLVAAVEEERAKGTILVLVTHDRELVARVDGRVIRLERGRVVGAAAPAADVSA